MIDRAEGASDTVPLAVCLPTPPTSTCPKALAPNAWIVSTTSFKRGLWAFSESIGKSMCYGLPGKRLTASGVTKSPTPPFAQDARKAIYSSVG